MSIAASFGVDDDFIYIEGYFNAEMAAVLSYMPDNMFPDVMVQYPSFRFNFSGFLCNESAVWLGNRDKYYLANILVGV